MLQNARQFPVAVASDQDDFAPVQGVLDFDRILSAIRRQLRVVLILAFFGLLLGVTYIATATPRYTATSSILIDKSSNRLVNELALSEQASGSYTDEVAIQSQAEVLKSDGLAGKVVDELKLAENEAFLSPPGSPLRAIKNFVVSTIDLSSWFEEEDEAKNADERRRLAVAILKQSMDVSRVSGTSVLAISALSTDPVLSARIADGYASVYLTDQLDSKFEATRLAGGWLQGRIEELRERSLASDRAVQEFRAKNGLITSDGRLVSDQQLTQLNTQMITAQAEVTTAKARYDRITELVNSGDTSAVVSDTLSSNVINELRTKYLEASKREAEISARLGDNHQQAVRLRNEMNEYRRLMFGELGRLAQSYRNDYEVALAREAAARAGMESATTISASANQMQVQLRELEREAESYRSLYQTFLQRYQQAIQQQSFPIAEARIISKATTPDSPSRPKKALALILALFVGGAAGAGIGAYREFRERFFRTSDQIREELGLEPLGLVPALPLKQILPTDRDMADARQRRSLLWTNNLARYVVDNPFSSFAETMRSAKIASDLVIDHPEARVIGIASALPGEGKSLISANFASLLALQGRRTLLIDCDLRNPGLTRSIAPHATENLYDVVLHGRNVEEVMLKDPEIGLYFLPAATNQRMPHTPEILTSHAMQNLLNEMSKSFEYIVIDLPPLGIVVDARALASRIDAFNMVVEWGATSRRTVWTTLMKNQNIAEKCVGVVLNKVDSKMQKLYSSHDDADYTQGRYGNYYREGH